MCLYGFVVMLIFFDFELGLQLFKCDFVGYYIGYKGIVVGFKQQEVFNYFEKKFKNWDYVDGDWKEVVEFVIIILSMVFSMDFKKIEIEIGIVGGLCLDGKEGIYFGFRIFIEDEIDDRLQVIVEKD